MAKVSEEYSIRHSGDISLPKAGRVLAKVIGATVFKGAGLISGTTKAVATMALRQEEDTYTFNCLAHSNRTHYRGSTKVAFNYVIGAMEEERLQKDKVSVKADI